MRHMMIKITGNYGSGITSLMDNYHTNPDTVTRALTVRRGGDPSFRATVSTNFQQEPLSTPISFTVSDINEFDRATRAHKSGHSNCSATIIVVDPTDQKALQEKHSQYNKMDINTRISAAIATTAWHGVMTLVITKCDLAHPKKSDNTSQRDIRRAIQNNIDTLSKIAHQKNIPVFQTSTQSDPNINGIRHAFDATVINAQIATEIYSKIQQEEKQRHEKPVTLSERLFGRSESSAPAAPEALKKTGSVSTINHETSFDSEPYASISNEQLASLNTTRMPIAREDTGAAAAAARDIGAFATGAAATDETVLYTDNAGNQYTATPLTTMCCSILHELMNDPVILIASGQTYERAAIVAWLNQSNTDPLSGQVVHDKSLQENLFAKQAIDEWKITHMLKKSAAAPRP